MTEISLADLPAHIAALPPKRMLTLIGLDASMLRKAMESAQDQTRQVLVLDLANSGTAAAIIDRILDDLAELALSLWPDWYGNDPAIAAGPDVHRPWRRAAGRLAEAKRPPRFRHTPSKIEFEQLLLAIDPAGLVLLASLDVTKPVHATPVIAALEWCAGHGAAVVILCPTRPDAVSPFVRILFGAIEVNQPPAPVLSRLIVPQGKAHHSSDTEARVKAAVQQDPELGPLFVYNKCVTTHAPGFVPRVDLVWNEGRIVVELDGPDHQGDPKYDNDRHRDYELLIAGYLVLRLTNAQIAMDLQLAIEKIRRVVRYRRFEGGLNA